MPNTRIIFLLLLTLLGSRQVRVGAQEASHSLTSLGQSKKSTEISGTVTDSRYQPLAGIKVKAWRGVVVLRTVVTDSNGGYSLFVDDTLPIDAVTYVKGKAFTEKLLPGQTCALKGGAKHRMSIVLRTAKELIPENIKYFSDQDALNVMQAINALPSIQLRENIWGEDKEVMSYLDDLLSNLDFRVLRDITSRRVKELEQKHRR